MKNFFKGVALALVMMCSTGAMAQVQGQSEVGVNFGYQKGAKDLSNVGIGIKYGYMFTDALRFELGGMYYFKGGKADKSYFSEAKRYNSKGNYSSGKDTDWFDVNLNAHYLFNVGEQFNIYPIFGFTTMFGNTSFKLADKGFKQVSDLAGVQSAGGTGFYNDVTKQSGDDTVLKDSYSDHHFRFGVNIGFGGQYNITEDFGVTLEAKYKLIKDFGNFNVMLGCVVLF